MTSETSKKFMKIKQVLQAVDPVMFSAELSFHPEYPEHVLPIGKDDEYYRDLLDRAWGRKSSILRTTNLTDEKILRPKQMGKARDETDDIDPNGALYRVGEIVVQLLAKRTTREAVVLGRVGVIEIYREKLAEKLSGADDEGLKITASDVARVLALLWQV
jgi:hypothetical protein